MKTRMIGVLVAVTIMMSGCGMSSSQRIAILDEMLQNAESLSDELGERITQVGLIIEETRIALADPNLPDKYRAELDVMLADSLAKVELVSAEREKWDAKIVVLREQVEEAKASDMSFGDELVLYGKNLTTIGKSVPAPIGPFVTLAGVIVGAVGTVVAKKRKTQLTAVVKSVDVLLESPAVSNAKKAKEVLKMSQRKSGVQAAVDKIRN